jgi:hypothetical protein
MWNSVNSIRAFRDGLMRDFPREPIETVFLDEVVPELLCSNLSTEALRKRACCLEGRGDLARAAVEKVENDLYLRFMFNGAIHFKQWNVVKSLLAVVSSEHWTYVFNRVLLHREFDFMWYDERVDFHSPDVEDNFLADIRNNMHPNEGLVYKALLSSPRFNAVHHLNGFLWSTTLHSDAIDMMFSQPRVRDVFAETKTRALHEILTNALRNGNGVVEQLMPFVPRVKLNAWVHDQVLHLPDSMLEPLAYCLRNDVDLTLLLFREVCYYCTSPTVEYLLTVPSVIDALSEAPPDVLRDCYPPETCVYNPHGKRAIVKRHFLHIVKQRRLESLRQLFKTR